MCCLLLLDLLVINYTDVLCLITEKKYIYLKYVTQLCKFKTFIL